MILEPHNYSQNQIGLIGVLFTMTGVIAGIIGSIYIDN